MTAKSKESLSEGNLYFRSTVEFSDSLTKLLAEAHENLSSINVKIDFSSLKLQDNVDRLCDKTFRYLGIKETLTLY